MSSGDQAGASIALSDDGLRVAIGARIHYATPGASAPGGGHVRVSTRAGVTAIKRLYARRETCSDTAPTVVSYGERA